LNNQNYIFNSKNLQNEGIEEGILNKNIQALNLNGYLKKKENKNNNRQKDGAFYPNFSINDSRINGNYKVKLANGYKSLNGNMNENGINGFSNYNYNNNYLLSNGFNDGINIFTNGKYSEMNTIPNINFMKNSSFPSYISMNEINENSDITNHILFQNQNMKKDFNENIKSINNVNNINNTKNLGNINNVIFTNNFNNINISSLDENKFQNIFSNLNNFNINDITDNNTLNNINNINIFNNINELNDDDEDKKDELEYDENYSIYKLLSLKDIKNKNGKKLNKKKNNLFHNESNKEKDIRDFKRFCDGLKYPLPDYICSQVGSRVMQKYLNKFPSFIITNLIEKLNIYFEKIMCNVYGNYFSQKLYSISSNEQRRMILNYMKDIFVTVSENAAGAHVSQTIIELCESKEEKDIIMDYIKDHEMELSLHPEGTHVLQKIIQIFAENERQSLTDVLCTHFNVFTLCQDLKGISVIKRLISFNKDKMNRMKLVDSFFPNILPISHSSSGSYIIQFLIEQWGIDICLKLIHFTILNFEVFAVNKHSVNFINKIILICFKRNSIIRSFNNVNNINIMNCNEIIIINALKRIILEPNKIVNVYKNKFGKALVLKIRKLFNVEENKKLYLFIKSLENTPNYLESKKYKIYVEILKSQ
jgi:hypothetical protein